MKNYKQNLNIISFVCLSFFTVSCNERQKVKDPEPVINRKYSVRLSNHIGSDWYDCDTIIRLSDTRIQLKNFEDSTYYVDITIPQNVVLRIYPR